MAKRKCEFEDVFTRCNKFHVGIMENATINNISMNKIHNKTLMLLFKGAKNAQNGKNPAENKSAQLKINDNICGTCNNDNVIKQRCDYCDKNICTWCAMNCRTCTLFYCKSCCVNLYCSDSNEGICFSCYSTSNTIIPNEI